MKNNIDLYHFPLTPASHQIRLLLGEKGLGWNDFHINALAGDDMRIDYLSLDSLARRPILVHQGRLVAGFDEIITYIESNFRIVSLAPIDQDQHQRMMRLVQLGAKLPIMPLRLGLLPGFIAGWGQSWLERRINQLNLLPRENPEIGEACQHAIRTTREWKKMLANPSVADDARSKITLYLDKAAKRLDKKPYLMGNRYSVADSVWVGALCCLRDMRLLAQVTAGNRPILSSYIERCLQRPGAEPYLKSHPKIGDWLQWGMGALANFPDPKKNAA